MQDRSYFWPSFVDLMTSLFFIMLVMFAIYYVKTQRLLKEKEQKAKEYERIAYLNRLLDPIRKDTKHFKYDPQYNRYLLTQDVKFVIDRYDINNISDLMVPGQDPAQVWAYLTEAGQTVKTVVENLYARQQTLNGAKYMVVLTGVASNLGEADHRHNYDLSYWRAKSLYEFWKRQLNFDLDDPKYHKVLELSIGGVGVGGVDRFTGSRAEEEKNQRIIIQIVPKPVFSN